MAEYIKREAIKYEQWSVWRSSEPPLMVVRKETIDAIPPADVAPVVHGEWLLKHIGVGHYWECSICHTNPCIYVTQHTKFCPNCGAKMDGGTEND